MVLLYTPVYFTPIYTINTKCININPNWTIKQLYESIGPIIKQMFQIDEFILIEMKNRNTYSNFPKEAQPYIPINSNASQKLKDIWSNKLNVSFYIKDLNNVYPQLDTRNILFQRSSTCPICFDVDYLCNRYGCSHYLCDNCYAKCYETVATNGCPICRKKID
jgi:hypothetical protein